MFSIVCVVCFFSSLFCVFASVGGLSVMYWLSIILVIRNSKEKQRKPRKTRRRRRKKRIRPEKVERLEKKSTIIRKDTRMRGTRKARKNEITTIKGSSKQRILRRATLLKNMGSRLVPRILLIVLLTAIKGTSHACRPKVVMTPVSAF